MQNHSPEAIARDKEQRRLKLYPSHSKEKIRAATIRYRERNLEKIRAAGRKNWRKYRDWYIDKIRIRHRKYHHTRQLFLDGAKQVPCADCKKEYAPWILDFDHVRGQKEFTISHRTTSSIARLKTEMAKSDIVCANCHRERTYQRRENAKHDNFRNSHNHENSPT